MKHLSRRGFLKSAAGTTALVISIGATPIVLASDADNSGNVSPCIRFDSNGQIFLCVPIPDMGQGTFTAAAQIIAEELDLDLTTTSIEMMTFQGHADASGMATEGPMPQGAGGSLSIMTLWGPLRRSAAYARELFIYAAASQWGVPSKQLTTTNGMVVDRRNKKELAYKDLVARTRAAQYTVVPESAKPKARKSYTQIGKDQPNIHAHDIVTGKPLFGIDVEIPGMLHAAIRRCPNLNGSLVSYDREALVSMPGVRHVV